MTVMGRIVPVTTPCGEGLTVSPLVLRQPSVKHNIQISVSHHRGVHSSAVSEEQVFEERSGTEQHE